MTEHKLWRLRTIGPDKYNSWEWFPLTDDLYDQIIKLEARILPAYSIIIFKQPEDITAFKLQNGLGIV